MPPSSQMAMAIEAQAGEQTFRILPLPPTAVQMDYLPLRVSTLSGEKGWAKADSARHLDLLDRYDAHACPFGAFLDDQFIGGIRLVLGASPAAIPSGRFLPESLQRCGPVGEISRAMVHPKARNCGVFTVLFLRCLMEAAGKNIPDVFITVVDSPRIRRFLERHGFELLGLPFWHEDDAVAPKDPTVLFYRRLGTVRGSVINVITELQPACDGAVRQLVYGKASNIKG